MARAWVFVAAMVLLPSASALSAGMNLYWNDCSAGMGMTTNRAFTCDTNAGSNVLVVSFAPPAGITKLIAARAVIGLRSASHPMPLWWRLGAGGCREGSLTVSFAPPASHACAEYWSGAILQELSYSTEFGGDPDRARIVISFAIPEAAAGPVIPETEYYAFSLAIDNAKSMGSGMCGGCADPSCIVLEELTLYQSPGLGDYRICYPWISNYVTWQGGAIGGAGCPPYDDIDPCTTPALNRTWGRMKSLYR